MTCVPSLPARHRVGSRVARSAFAWVVVTAIAMGTVVPASAAEAASATTRDPAATSGDVDAPVVESFDITPDAVDLFSGAQSVTVTARLADVTGVQAPTVVLDSDTSSQRAGLGAMTLTAGTATSGVWSRTITLPATAAGGRWTALMYPVSDVAGNNDNTYHYASSGLNVTAPPGDVTPPNKLEFVFSTGKVNVSGSAQTVTVSVHATDASGVVAPYLELESTTTTQTLGAGEMTLTSGTSRDGTWSRDVTIPTTAAPGAWEATLRPLVDVVGNSNGISWVTPSQLWVSTTVPTAPAAPEAPRVTRADGTVTLEWYTPAEHESDITGYSVTSQPDGVTRTFTVQETACNAWCENHVTLTDLTIGSTYRFTIAATNAVGTGSGSALSEPVVPAHVPGTPTGVDAVAGDHRIAATWIAPASDGEPVSSYELSAIRTRGSQGVVVGVPADPDVTPGSQQRGVLESDSLENGVEYTISVRAYNGAGHGAASTDVVRVTPVGPPTAPGNVDGVGGDAAMTVNWTAPTSDGGAPITGYVVSATPRPDGAAPVPTPQTVDASARSTTFTGLSNGVAYDFSVQAVNRLGTSPAGVRTEKPARAPDAPTAVTVTRGDTTASLSWTPPTFDGGDAINFYRITASPGGATTWADVSSTSTTFTGLSNGTHYTFSVQAVNLYAGAGPAGVSATVVPAGVPASPAKPGVVAGRRFAAITWHAPSSNGTPITTYQVRASNGVMKTVSAGVRKLKFTGLRRGKRLSFRVRAVNSLGHGTYSTASRVVRIR